MCVCVCACVLTRLSQIITAARVDTCRARQSGRSSRVSRHFPPHFASLSADCHSPWAACSLTLFVACFIKLFTVFTAGFCNVLVFGTRRSNLTGLMIMIDCNDYDDDDDDNADKHMRSQGRSKGCRW